MYLYCVTAIDVQVSFKTLVNCTEH